MPSFTIPNSAVIGAFNAASALQSWLRPGLLAYTVGTHVDALRPHAIRLDAERTALLGEAAKRYPDLIPEGEPNAGEPHPMAGQHVTVEHPTIPGARLTPYRSPDSGAEFARREAELMGASTTLTVDERLTIDHIRKLDTERLPAPRGSDTSNGGPPQNAAVDFTALMPLIERASYDSNGVAAPARRAPAPIPQATT